MNIKRFNNFGKVLTENVNGIYACGGGGGCGSSTPPSRLTSGCGFGITSCGYPYIETESEKRERRRTLRKKKLAVVQKEECEKCGTTLAKDSLFCHKCGTKINNE
ncbi:hypothetical protein M0Q50_03370 [bacterium]|jgi:hypothetical protein|nr:hypothetical protein [bacterium]